jgi:hypothetical protein
VPNTLNTYPTNNFQTLNNYKTIINNEETEINKLKSYFYKHFSWPLVGQDPLIIEASRSHSGTPHQAELLWMGDQPEEETSA